MILVLAGLELTTNDVHDRITRSLSRGNVRPGAIETTVQLATMRFNDSDTLSTRHGVDTSVLPTISFQERSFQEKPEKDLEASL